VKDEGGKIVDAEEEMCTISSVDLTSSCDHPRSSPVEFLSEYLNIPGAEMVFVLTQLCRVLR
jgi:hypothetical protein